MRQLVTPNALILAEMDNTTTGLLIVAALMVVVWPFLRSWRKSKDPLEKPAAFSSLAAQRKVEQQMSHLLVELSDMSRQISAQLDTRAAKLEVLIQQADQRLAELKSQLEFPRPVAGTSPVTKLPAPPDDDLDPRHLEIYSLADQGMPASQIARKLNRPNGEVELILALRRR